MKVCIAKDDKYDDSMGAYTLFYLWDGEQVMVEGGIYSGLPYNTYEVNATHEQKVAASQAYMDAQKEGFNFNKHCYSGRGAYTFIGCVVELSRSRKAPNKTPLEVIAFFEGGYDSRYNHDRPEQVTVTDGENNWIVSSSCINKVIKGVKEKPFWFTE